MCPPRARPRRFHTRPRERSAARRRCEYERPSEGGVGASTAPTVLHVVAEHLDHAPRGIGPRLLPSHLVGVHRDPEPDPLRRTPRPKAQAARQELDLAVKPDPGALRPTSARPGPAANRGAVLQTPNHGNAVSRRIHSQSRRIAFVAPSVPRAAAVLRPRRQGGSVPATDWNSGWHTWCPSVQQNSMPKEADHVAQKGHHARVSRVLRA